MFEWNDIITTTIRSTVSILTLFILTKFMGRKQISQLCIFDYIIGISIGSIAAQMTVDTEIYWLHFVVAMTVFVVVYVLIAVLTVKSLWARKFFEGAPILLAQDGKIIRKNLAKVRYDINNFLEECRGAGYFDVNDIEAAIMESNGKVSILPKVNKRPANVEDLKLSPKMEGLVANVIMDGKIMSGNLDAIGKNETWLIKELKKKDVKSPQEVLLATCDVNDTLNVFLKDENINVRHCLE